MIIQFTKTSDQLICNKNIDKVKELQMKKPEIGVSGFENKIDSAHESLLGTDNPTIADVPNFYNERGTFVSNEGHIRIPRSLLEDSKWRGLRLKYQKVFITILTYACYTEKKFDIDHNTVTLLPGQLCTSIRNLVDLCNKDVIFKADKVDKNIVERSVSLFLQIGIVRQEVRHGKSIFTITQSDIYEHFKRQHETQSETNSRLNRDINEERKEREYIKDTYVNERDDRSSSLQKEEKTKTLSVFEIPNESKQKLDEQQQKQFSEIWKFLIENRMADGHTSPGSDGVSLKGVKTNDVEKWLLNYPLDEIKATIIEVKEKGVKESYPGYIQTLLKSNFAKKDQRKEINKKNIKELIQVMNLSHFKIQKQYVTDLTNNETYNFDLPEETFNGLIKNSIDRDFAQRSRKLQEQDIYN